MASKTLTADEVRALLTEAGVDQSALTITDDPAVWTNIETGDSGTSVLVTGPKEARRLAHNALFGRGFACAPYPDEDYWSR